jgi:hypothetical protein
MWGEMTPGVVFTFTFCVKLLPASSADSKCGSSLDT